MFQGRCSKAAFSYSISKVSISFSTEMIVSILYALAPAKANPFSRCPFLALVKAAQMQYGELIKSQVFRHCQGHLNGLLIPDDTSSRNLFFMALPGNPTGLSIMVRSSFLQLTYASLNFMETSHS